MRFFFGGFDDGCQTLVRGPGVWLRGSVGCWCGNPRVCPYEYFVDEVGVYVESN